MALDPDEDRRRRAARARRRYAADPERERARVRAAYKRDPGPARARAKATRDAERAEQKRLARGLATALRESVPEPVPYDGNASSRWQDRAACVGLDPELFFTDGKVPAEARAACLGCPVRAECLGFALSFPGSHLLGFWAGTSHSARIRMKSEALRAS